METWGYKRALEKIKLRIKNTGHKKYKDHASTYLLVQHIFNDDGKRFSFDTLLNGN